MRPFAYTRADDLGESVAALGDTVRPYAGGTDLLTRMKLGITTPERLLDIKSLELPRGIERRGDTLRIGALTTLVEIERHDFPPALALLAEAASKAATPQLRERATLGGNLLQRPRCWYYRHAEVSCWLKGGEGCPAREGRNEHHAIFGDGHCVAVHPSDLASCLLALDATVTLRGGGGSGEGGGERTLPLADFFAAPNEERRHESVIADDELVTAVDIPLGALGEGSSSVYLKAMDRKVWAFALVGLAAVATPSDEGGRTLRLVASGVASTPWRLEAVEKALADVDTGDGKALEAAVERALSAATPLAHNGYKVPLLRRLVAHALESLERG